MRKKELSLLFTKENLLQHNLLFCNTYFLHFMFYLVHQLHAFIFSNTSIIIQHELYRKLLLLSKKIFASLTGFEITINCLSTAWALKNTSYWLLCVTWLLDSSLIWFIMIIFMKRNYQKNNFYRIKMSAYMLISNNIHMLHAHKINNNNVMVVWESSTMHS